jgi:multidrug efflux system membrane fusion protein
MRQAVPWIDLHEARVAARLVALLCAACASCSRSMAAPPPKPPPPEVSVARVATRTIADYEESTGRLAAIDSIEVHPRVGGYIEAVHFTQGSRVKQGALLFRIDPRPFEQQVDRLMAERRQARSQLALVQLDHERVQRLFEAHSISREAFDQSTTAQAQAMSALDAVEASLASARIDLGYTRVRAPIDGRASSALITKGNLVSSASTLTTIVSDGAIYGDFDVDESAYLKLTHGGVRANQVTMALSDEQGFPRRGTLEFFNNQLDPRTGTIRVRVRFDNEDGRLVPGLFARVRIQAGSPAPALLVDDKAVLIDQDRKFVYVLDAQHRAQRKNVRVGRVLDDGLRVVSDGLDANDRVIVYGVQKIFVPGMPVRPVEIVMGAPPPGAAPGRAPPD